MNTNYYKQIVENINQKKPGKIILVSGKFNILHPGHIRLFKFAKELGDFLVVALEPDEENGSLLPGLLRLEALQASNYVDYAFILNSDAKEFIKILQPNIVVKGNEYEDRENPEKQLIESYGGKLVFSSGEMRFSSLNLLKQEFDFLGKNNFKKSIDFLERHKTNHKNLINIIKKFSTLNVLVIGDTIVDEYITCDPLGMSQEDPTIVVSPISSDKFLGGAGIVAAHARGLGAKVNFYSVTGLDENNKFVEDKLKEYDILAFLYKDSSRPTTLKQKFRSNGKTLLRVNHLKQHHIDKDLQNKIYNDLKGNLKNIDLIIFSDFSYGCLPQKLVDKIILLAKEKNVMMVADSQCSSQVGDISRFKDMILVTPTEKEARLAVNDFESGLIVLAEKLIKKSNIKHVILTLAAEGLVIHTTETQQKIITDQLPAMNNSPKDVSGCGDSLLACSSLALAVGANIWESAYLGSIAAAHQVSRVGNLPLTSQDILYEINA